MKISEEKIFFSVIMVVHKWGLHTKKAIDSVLSQNYSDFELIIVDNSKSQNIDEDLNCYTLIDRVRVIKSLYHHLSYSLNLGASFSLGEYLVRMDDDDISEPRRFEILNDFLNENPTVDVVGSNAIYIDSKGDVIGNSKVKLPDSSIRRELITKCAFIHPSVAIKRQTFFRHGGYLGGLRAQDYDLWLRMSLDKSVVFANLFENTIRYRIHDNQTKGSRQSYIDGITSQFRFFLAKPSLYLFLVLLARVVRFFTLVKR
ncbi:glycosyltransferase [Vibrio breoganii]